MKRLKDLYVIPSAADVEEIVESDVRAVAAVDRPATDRRWRYFKSLPAGLTTKIPEDNQETPAGLEADSSLAPVLRADVFDSDSRIDSLSKVYREIEDALASGELGQKDFTVVANPAAKPGGDDPCYAAAIADGLSPDEARAACADKEKVPMKRSKDEAAAAAPPPTTIEDVEAAVAGEAPQQAETIEIPATPTEWPLGDCVNQATGLGMDHQQAVNACAIVYGEYGDPSDEETILVPEGNTPEGLLNGAAIRMGLKMKFENPPEQVKFTGQNFWDKLTRRFLGRKSRSGAVEYLKGLESRLEGVMAEQRKSKDDLRYVVDRMLTAITQQSQTMAALAGVPLPEAAAVSPEPVAVAEAEEKAAPAAGAKDGAAAGAPVAPPQQGTEQRIAALEAALQEILAAVQGGGSALPEPEEEELLAPVPTKRISVPVVAGGVNRLAAGAKSLAPAASATQFSTMYGVNFSAAERAAIRNNTGGLKAISVK